MYTRFYKYSVKPDMKEEFLDVHQLISDVILDAMGGRIQYLRNMNETSEWIVMQQLESKDLYDRRKDQVEAELETSELKSRLNALLLVPETQVETTEYYMFMEVQASDEY